MARRILFYTHAFGGGGAETVFSRLAARFAEAGDDVVFAADTLGPAAPADKPRLRHVLLGAGHLRSTGALATLLRHEQPDASFSALGAQNLKHVAAAVWTGRRNRCVLGYHGFAAAEAKPLSRLSFWAAPLMTRTAARTVCVSDVLLADMRTRWYASRARTLRIYNPLAAPSDIVAPGRDPVVPPLILACGRLVAGKRFPDLVAALSRVRPATARLAILGDGPDKAAIDTAIAHYDLADRVEMPGHVPDPTPWYRRAACLAIASDSESFGLTAAEALAFGVPVVTTDCGGPPEILGAGRYGRIAPIGDIAKLAEALSDTIAAPGDDAPRRERAATFALATIHRAYADLIDSLP